MKKFVSSVMLLFIALSVVAQPGKATVNGITIAYQSYGTKNKDVMLLIAGTNAQLTMWTPAFCNKLVSKGFRVIVFDNRDIGLSTKFDQAGLPDWGAITKAIEEKQKPPLAYSVDDMAKDAVGLLDVLKIAKAHVVGASMGGLIAQRVAYFFPDRVLSLTSIMSGGGRAIFPLVAKPDVVGTIPYPGAPDDTASYVQRELISMKILAGNKYKLDDKKTLALIRANVKRSYHPNGLVRQGAASLAAFYAGRENELKQVKAPSLIIHGTDDPLVALEAGKDVAALIPNSIMEIIEGMGHDLPESLYDKFVALIVSNTKRRF
jgi:pimeloyl-ACP methyl ester carboxylesterase